MKPLCLVAWIGLLIAFSPAPRAALGAQPLSAVPAPPPVADVGPLLNPKQPLDGVRTGGFTASESFPVLAGEGFKTYIDLRSDAEIVADPSVAARAAGLRFERIPIAGDADLNLGTARALDALLDDRAIYPVVVACGSGNRVGALLALRAFWLDRATAEAALDLGRRAGLTKLEPTVRILLGLPPAPPAAPVP